MRWMQNTIVWCAVIGMITVGLGQTTPARPSLSKDQAQEADAAFKAGYAALAQNDPATARKKFERVVKLAPHIEEGHSALGAVLLELNVYAEAIAELRYAVKLKPEDTAAQTNLAVAL